MRDLCIQPIPRAYDGHFRIGVEKIKDATGCYLDCVNMSTFCARACTVEAHLAAADNHHFSVLHLPREDQRATALRLGEGFAHHIGRCRKRNVWQKPGKYAIG